MGVLYWTAPTAHELKDGPYKLTDFPEPKCEVWDEHWDALLLFRQYSSQWRFSMNGPAALDLVVFIHALERKNVDDQDFERIMGDLRLIERFALTEMRKD